jgi:Protein of unknown function (DUF1552)
MKSTGTQNQNSVQNSATDNTSVSQTMSNKQPTTKPRTNWQLARRDLLKGLGIGLGGLPLLHAGRARAQTGTGAAKATGGLLVVLTSEGYRQGDWAPKTGPLASQTLPYACTPLEEVKSDLIFLPDLGNPFYGGPNVGGGHGSYGSIFWGGAPNGRVSYKQPQGKTVDQQVASNLPKLSHVSLAQAVQLDLSPKASPEAGSSRCFWAGKGQPINPVADPYAVYMDVFSGIMVGTPTNMGAEDPEIKKLMNKRKSLLDYVGKNLEAFKSRLGGEDKVAIEAHHTSVRDLEKQLQSGGSAPVGAGCAPQKGTMLNLGDRLQYPNILKAQMSLAVQALKCGVSRVATLQLSDSSGNNINFGFVEGVPGNGTGYKSQYRNYHDVGHNPVFQGVDHKRIVDRWMMLQFANLVKEMKAASLLDDGLILWGNHMQDGSNHVAGKIPWILAGKAGGYFNVGQCMPAAGYSINNVMSDICIAFGVPPSFGETKGGLKAA